jgi:hypothetical protein
MHPEEMEEEIIRLRKQVEELQARCGELQGRAKITKMSAEVVDSNPYRCIILGSFK